MSERLGRWVSDLDSLLTALPLWSAGVLAVVFILFFALAFDRAGRDGLIGGVARTLLIVLGAGLAWFFLESGNKFDFGAERRALETRAGALAARATMPGSPLACLDAMAGETVEGACERSLFATPEATAAAVSHVVAQLDLLADVHSFVARGNAALETLRASLRRAVEGDRYGLVAHVLATRDGCASDQCPALAMMRDAQRVNANLAQRSFEAYVARHSAAWPSVAPVVGAAPATGPAALAAAQPLPAGTSALVPPATRPPGPGVFFPSSETIPAVNIMSAEPSGGPDSAGGAPARTPPPRRPAQTAAPQPKQPPVAPIDLNAAARGAPAAGQ
jgi:hypothetical protein